MANIFRTCDIMLPRDCDYGKWAVIACDQHTSEQEYWDNVETYVGDAPSTLNVFFPEAYLKKISDKALMQYASNIRQMIAEDFFKTYRNSYVYVERTLLNGEIRQGVVGVIDLEYYDYSPKPMTKIFATEATVLQRVPPRIALRKISNMEFSHTVMFCEDDDHCLIEPLGALKSNLEKLYDFELMTNGGRITGYLLHDDDARHFEERLAEYEKNHIYLVGDGNHSLVTAKLTYEAMKASSPDTDWINHPARYAMVELENINSDAMVFEPIYRIAMCDDATDLVENFKALDCDCGIPITWIHGSKEGVVKVPVSQGELPIEAVQRFLDKYTSANNGSVDYIHGSDTVRKLAQSPDTVGFLQPDFDKAILFPYILSGKVMPKKTFSIGHAEEKRYYLEGRTIK